MAETLVVIPTYNERENIADIVGRVRAATPDVDVLVVDDNSPDGTGAIADGLAASDPRVFVRHRTAKNGLGMAYGEAFRWALARGYDRIVEMDADGSHAPEQLPSLLRAADAGADVVLGSRWIAGGGVENWPKYRELLSRGGSGYARLVLGLPQRDVTGGYRVLTAHALGSIRLEDVHSQGYGFQVDMLFHAQRAGLAIVEVPITFVERERGESKMTGGIVAEAMLRVTLWGIGALPGRLRRRLVR
ncbi:dolichol-phosphate mannosyltransferase [Okibacterium sp. HSC-33S16]|uniref:polyprenol monophosphomannose synthase n=1 Tax=Okibacterium sp. HSC-33S16 TaxID=2910965 RepID=UPI0020A130D4|nr:polyprenol monophosphomannose synthase [Okibacterium sp. HSC-33S16]MCP2032833.1 dolichol-phosphate mannosyltransferase [Okibacterium sp. HSC-33S16]